MPHDDTPVVCVADVAKFAIFRALAHSANHPDLGPGETSHGWTAGGQLFATQPLIDSIRRQGDNLCTPFRKG